MSPRLSRNGIVLFLFGASWLMLYLFVFLISEAPLPPRWLSLVAIPFVAGAVLGVTLVGSQWSKVGKTAFTLVVAGLITILSFLGGREFTAGGAFLLLYVLLPIPPVLLAVLATHKLTEWLDKSNS